MKIKCELGTGKFGQSFPPLPLLHQLTNGEKEEGLMKQTQKNKTHVWLRNTVGETTMCFSPQCDILRPNYKQCMSLWKLSEFIEQIPSQNEKKGGGKQAGNSAPSFKYKRKHFHFPHLLLLKLRFRTRPSSEGSRIYADTEWRTPGFSLCH